MDCFDDLATESGINLATRSHKIYVDIYCWRHPDHMGNKCTCSSFDISYFGLHIGLLLISKVHVGLLLISLRYKNLCRALPHQENLRSLWTMEVFPGFLLLLIFTAQKAFSSENAEVDNMLLSEFQFHPRMQNISDGGEEAEVMRRQSPGLDELVIHISPKDSCNSTQYWIWETQSQCCRSFAKSW